MITQRSLPPVRQMFDEEQGRLSDQWDEFTKSMNAETRRGLSGDVSVGGFGSDGFSD